MIAQDCKVEYIEQIDLPRPIIDLFLVDYRAQRFSVKKEMEALETRYRALCHIIKRLEAVRNGQEVTVETL